MYTFNERNALFEIFKSGTLPNIQLALQLAEQSEVDLCLPHFEALFDYLSKVEAIKQPLDLPLAEKIHCILATTALKIIIKEEAFAVIPASIALLKNLKQLTIGAHIEVHLPQTITFLEQLEDLELYLLDQEQLPNFIFELASLIRLDLSLNLFSELPREIWQLRHLEELHLLHCFNLSVLPNELFGLPQLKRVYLLQTPIHDISPSIVYSSIEEYVWDIRSPKGKKVMTNPKIGTKILLNINTGNKWSRAFNDAMQSHSWAPVITNVPEAVLQQGTAAIKTYFRGVSSKH